MSVATADDRLLNLLWGAAGGARRSAVIPDEVTKIDIAANPPRRHCLKCGVRMTSNGNSRRRRSTAKSDYCLACARDLTPSQVASALLREVRAQMKDPNALEAKSSKPRPDALDKVMNSLEVLTGWPREELRRTAQDIVSLANDRELGDEYKKLRQWMEKRSASDGDGTMWDEYQRQNITSMIVNLGLRQSVDPSVWSFDRGQVWNSIYEGQIDYLSLMGRRNGKTASVVSSEQLARSSRIVDDADLALSLHTLSMTATLSMPMTLNPDAIAILTGVAGC